MDIIEVSGNDVHNTPQIQKSVHIMRIYPSNYIKILNCSLTNDTIKIILEFKNLKNIQIRDCELDMDSEDGLIEKNFYKIEEDK